MKIRIAKSALLDALMVVQGAVAARTTLPILSNVLLMADKGKLWMTTTDLELSIRCGVDAEVIKGGGGTVPARRLVSIVKELPSSEVEIEIDDKAATSIRCGASFFKVMGLSEDEFPPMPRLEGALTYSLDQGVFKRTLDNVSYAASTDETRYVLNGVLMSCKGDKLVVAATDGRRLALVEHEMEFPKEAEADIIIPTKTVTQLLHSLRDEGQMKICSLKSQVAFEFNDIVVISKLLEGSYPNYRQVIPSQSEERIAIERELLLTAVKRVSLMTSDKTCSIRLSFSNNNLAISTTTPDVGEALETIAVKYTGKDMSVTFNPEYLMDPLRHLKNDEVYLELTDELSPGVIKCDTPFLYVLMPMRIS